MTPGRTVGIDSDASALAKARAYAAERDVPNLRFENASVYELPFPDESFDAIYNNAVRTHLADPEAAGEVARCSRSAGVTRVDLPVVLLRIYHTTTSTLTTQARTTPHASQSPPLQLTVSGL